MEDFDQLIGHLAADDSYAITLSARPIAETPHENRALGQQSKRDRNHEFTLTFFLSC
jgi:hypothetical protein